MIDLVFYIDDDPIASFIFGLTIKKSGLSKEFVAFNSSVEALEYFETQKSITKDEQSIPNLIFLDLEMPEMDGWEFLTAFNSQYSNDFPNVRIIILSSSVNPEDIEKGKSIQSVIDFYQKPLKVDKLMELKNSNAIKHLF